MDKKYLYAIVVVSILTLIAAIVYFFIKKPTLVSKKQPTKLMEGVKYFEIDSQNQILYITKQNGELSAYSIKNNKEEKISSKAISNLYKVVWSPNKKKVALLAGWQKNGLLDFSGLNEGEKNFFVLNLTDASISKLNNNITEVSWVNDEKIIYAYNDSINKSYNLSSSDYNGANWRSLFSSDMQIANLQKDSQNNIFYFVKQAGGSYFGEGDLIAYDYDTQKQDKIDSNVVNLNLGPKGILSYSKLGSEGKIEIMVWDKTKQKGILAKSVEYQTETIYKPASIDELILAENNNNEISFVKIYISKGEKDTFFKTQVSSIGEPVNLLISADGKTIYFIGKNILYKMDIK